MHQQLTFIDNWSGDPELRYLPDGAPVASFSLAVNKPGTDQEGERREKAT